MQQSLPRRVIDQLIRHPYALLATGVFIALGVSFMKKTTGDWDVTYLLSARHLWHGQTIYHNGDGYIYPPFPSLFALPFWLLPFNLPKLAWYAVTVTCFIFMCRWSWRLAGGPALQGRTFSIPTEQAGRCLDPVRDTGLRPVPAPREGKNASILDHSQHGPEARVTMNVPENRGAGRSQHVAFLLALIPGATYASNCISHSQTDIVIGFAIIAGCVAFTRGKPFLAATLYGLAAAMKGPALIWFPYLIARRKPVAAGWLVVVFIGANLLPNLISHQQSILFNDWAHDYLLPKKTAANVYPDVWSTESNQSLLGSITRWTTTRWEWQKSEAKALSQTSSFSHVYSDTGLRPVTAVTESQTVLPSQEFRTGQRPVSRTSVEAGPDGNDYRQRIPLAHPVPESGRKIILLGGYGLLLVVLATSLGWWPKSLDRSPNSIRPALEFSMVATLMLVCSPMAAKAQWGILMLPGFCLARLCITRRDPVLIFCFVAGWIAWIPSQNFITKDGVFVGLWYGAVLWNALIWFAGCAYALINQKPKIST